LYSRKTALAKETTLPAAPAPAPAPAPASASASQSLQYCQGISRADIGCQLWAMVLLPSFEYAEITILKRLIDNE
jgi:hypothetical protein